MVIVLLQTLCALFLVYGAFLSFAFAFGKETTRSDVPSWPKAGTAF